jgi:peptidoglycan/xylan/chitin deacetylase (PgdA/CDA1 family)
LAEVKHRMTLSVTERNNLGNIRVRHADDETQVFEVESIIEDGIPRSFEGLTPFFCLMAREITGQGVSEEPVKVFDAKKGTLKYTLSPNAFQMIGRNEAYFSFRKELSNGRWTEQFSTRTFHYTVEKSIYSEPFKDSNYWWTFKELYIKLNEYIASGKNDWEDFIDQNREVIESIDPGGILLNEVIQSRAKRPVLDDRLSEIENAANVSILSQTNKQSACKIVFTCDDGAYQDYVKLLPIVKEKKLKLSLAIIPDWVGKNVMETDFMTWDQIREFVALGSELMSHSTKQQDLTSLSDMELDFALRESQNTIKRQGFNCDFLVYPYGRQDERVRRATKLYYRGGLGIKGENKLYGDNSDLWTFNAARVGLGSSYDPVQIGFPDDTSSLEYYKARVDYAIDNRSMLIFMMHTAGVLDESQQQHLRDLIDYIRSRGIEPCTISEAYNTVGNVLEIGDKQSGYIKINSAGELLSNKNQFVNNLKITKIDEYSFELNALQLPTGLIYTPISTKKAQESLSSPVKIGGTLYTHNLRNVSFDFVFQLYIDVNGNRYERRIIDFEKLKWSDWEGKLKKIQINIDSNAMTVNAMGQVQITHKHTLFTPNKLVNVHPQTNLPFGFIFSSCIIDDDLVIRIVNINGTDVTLPKNKWFINFIG